MADLFLDEPLRIVELNEVRDVGMPKAVQIQDRIQPGRVPGLCESDVNPTPVQPPPPLGDP